MQLLKKMLKKNLELINNLLSKIADNQIPAQLLSRNKRNIQMLCYGKIIYYLFQIPIIAE